MRRPSNVNNIKKARILIANIMSKLKNPINFVVLQILIYFIEMDYYELYEDRLIGFTFKNTTNGPSSHLLLLTIESMLLHHEIAGGTNGYYIVDEIDSQLSEDEEIVIESVLNKLSEFSLDELIEYSKRDLPVAITKIGDTIDPESVFYRDVNYTVRND